MVKKVWETESTGDEEAYYAWRAHARPRPQYAITLFDSRLRRRAVAVTAARPGSRILDIGTGTGKQALAFGAAGYDVVGIDLSEDMLRVATRKNRYRNVRFEVARATELPFEDETFDVYTVAFALHDMPRYIRGRAVRAMARVTRAGGTIVVVAYGLPRNRALRFLVYHVARLWEKFYPEFIASDLDALPSQSGVEVRERAPVLLGTA